MTPQHVVMRDLLARVLNPLNLAGFAAWLAVAILLLQNNPSLRLDDALLATWLLAFLAGSVVGKQRRFWQMTFFLIEALITLALLGWVGEAGYALILLVVLVAQIAMCHSLRWVLIAAVVLNVMAYWLLRGNGYAEPLVMMLSFAGFQLFALVTSHYARSAEEARDRLLQVNADLLATRALFAESARDGERLRVARELHDVAGHKLTALRLNLRALQAASPSPQLQLADQLSGELLTDIRGVVHALRDGRGLDIATALRALAIAFPRPTLQLDIANGLSIDDPLRAEAVLRTVQEALTNAARHGQAATLHVQLVREADALRVLIEDDDRARWPLREGHGLTGMRERIESLAGRLRIEPGAQGGVRIEASIPA